MLTGFRWLASMVLAATLFHPLHADTRCPGNVASVPFRPVNRYQMIVAVSLNHSGPYNFLLDTGTQITMVDPALADELHLNMLESAKVAGVGFSATASFARADWLAVGDHAFAGHDVLVYDLRKLRSTGLDIRGVLGEDFLERFDMLIDNAHKTVCLDDTGAMRADIRGPHTLLETPMQTENIGPAPKSLIITVQLTDGLRPVRLKLDSGANVPFLYDPSQYLDVGLVHTAPWYGSGSDGSQREIALLPAQDVKIGSLRLSKVSFFSATGVHKDLHTAEYDGLLTTGSFRRVFIDHADHFVVFEAW